MKKILCLLLTAVFAFSFSVSGAKTERENILKVYNWADYIDEDVIPEFEQWYQEQTGEEIHVIYQLFDINEVMLAKIERGHEEYDVVCPSDYIIERMLRNDLLLPIDRDFGDTPNYIDENISPYIIDVFKKIDGSGKDANDYAVGYMWGTTGLLYNTKYVTKEEALTWGTLANPKFDKKLFMKDAFRDVYGPILMYLKQDELKSGKVTMDELMYDSSDESIALVETYLKQVKEIVAGWEADFGKEMMSKEKGYLNMTWSGDAVWAIEEARNIGVSLDYQVPAEGSNVWFDGWVIPKYAKNVKAAKYFINFLCRSDIAVRNMDAIGYVSAIASPEVLEAMQDSTRFEPLDATYFFGETGHDVCLNPVQYPDITVINRCAMMHDTGDRVEAMLAMWSRVKGDNLGIGIWIVLAAVVAAIIAYYLIKKKSNKKRNTRRKQQRRH